MKVKEIILSFLFFGVIASLFFYKAILFGHIPFPGDLLIAEYNPWKSYSYLGYNPGSYPNKAQYFDVLRQLYPWKTFSINSLKQGSLPLWNPYNFSGAPLLGNIQSAIFYPFNIVYFLLPQIFAWSFLIFLQLFLAGFFTFLYARKIGLSRIASGFSAISFAFSSFMTVWLEYNTIGQVVLWLPLILLSIENFIDKQTNQLSIWPPIFVFSLAASLFGGHIQIFVYLFVFSFIYSLFRGGKSLFFFILFLLPLGLGAVQLLPSLELIGQAARSSHTYSDIIHKILIQPWQLAMMFVPDFFGNPATRNYLFTDTYVGKVTSIGLIPLFFAAPTFFRKKTRLIKFFLWAAGTVLLFVTLNPVTYFFYKLKILFVSDSAPTLSIFILCFSLSILSGFGVDLWRKEKTTFKGSLKIIVPFFVLFVIFWTSLLFLPSNFVSISMRNLTYSTILFAGFLSILFVSILNNRAKTAVLVCLLLLTTFDLWRSFEKFNRFVPKELVYPSVPVLDFLSKNAGINRIWGYRSAGIDANFATKYSLFSPDGYDPLYPKRYGEFIQSSKEGNIETQFTDQTRSDAVLNFGRPKVLDLLGVKYVLDKDENASTQNIFPIDRYSLVYQKDGWKIFENKKALPRVFLVSDYKVVKNALEFEKTFFAKDFDPLKTIILEEGIGEHLNNIYHLSNIKVLSYTPNEIKISTNAGGSRLLFLSDTYFPGWRAYVDGKETKIYRADYTFRAIYLSSGSHLVKFSYQPDSFKFGLTVSLLTFFFLPIWLFTAKNRPQ